MNGWVVISFPMQSQWQDQWCWAATASSVSFFFDSGSTWTQCVLVNAEFGRNDCCFNGSSFDCNQPWYLDSALTRTGNFQLMIDGSPQMSEIVTEIDDNRPLCGHISWNGGGGHFVAITGYALDIDMVSVDDSYYGHSDITLNALINNYQGSGVCDTRYFVTG